MGTYAYPHAQQDGSLSFTANITRMGVTPIRQKNAVTPMSAMIPTIRTPMPAGLQACSKRHTRTVQLRSYTRSFADESDVIHGQRVGCNAEFAIKIIPYHPLLPSVSSMKNTASSTGHAPTVALAPRGSHKTIANTVQLPTQVECLCCPCLNCFHSLCQCCCIC